MRTRFFVATGILLVLLSIVRVVWWQIVMRPVLDAQQVAEIQSTIRTMRETPPSCARPVLRGEATPGDGTAALAALTDPHGRFAACWSLLGARSEDVAAALVLAAAPSGTADAELPPEPHADVEADDGPPVDPEWDYVAFGRPLHLTPLPIEAEVLAACASLDVEIERVARFASVCTPQPYDASTGDLHGGLRLGRAASIFVRERMRRGDRAGGLALALDTLRLAADETRGHASLISGALSFATTGVVLGQLELLLASDVPFEDAELAALPRELAILARTTPTPDAWMLAQPLVIASDTAPAADDPVALGRWHVELALVPYVRGRRADLACPLDEDREHCRERWRAERDRIAGTEPPASWRTWLGPHAIADELVLALWARITEDAVRYFTRAYQNEATMRALAIASEARRAQIASGACPDLAAVRAIVTSEVGRTAMDGFGGALMAHRSPDLPLRPIDVSAPSWLSPHGVATRAPVVELYCPPIPPVP